EGMGGGQARQERSEPENGGSDAPEQRETRPDGEWRQRDHDHKEQYADQRAAADAYGDPHVAHEKRAERGHGVTAPTFASDPPPKLSPLTGRGFFDQATILACRSIQARRALPQE